MTNELQIICGYCEKPFAPGAGWNDYFCCKSCKEADELIYLETGDAITYFDYEKRKQ